MAPAVAQRRPEAIEHLALLDAFLPGLMDESELVPRAGGGLWQFGFHQVPGLPERLVDGRERAYLAYFLTSKSATPGPLAGLDEYSRAYSLPGRMSAAFGYYRALDRTGDQLRARRALLPMPVLTLDGGAAGEPKLQRALAPLAPRLTGLLVPAAGHFIAEENPQVVARALRHFLDAAQ